MYAKIQNKKHSKLDDETSEKKKGRRSKMEKRYPIGTELLQFMISRELISLSMYGNLVRIDKKNGAYYLPTPLFVVCNFNLAILPIKLSLPMVCKPREWKPIRDKGQQPRYLSELTGGYLSCPTSEFHNYRYSLMTSIDLDHFYIDLKENYQTLCDVMNKLQNQPYRINSKLLNFINNEYENFVNAGLLMPKILTRMNILKVAPYLREIYMNDKRIQKILSYSDLLQILSNFIQRASYDNFIIKLATAYDGYDFYLPAFLDFRGRIYRSGVLHFHERDLARSLIVFAGQTCDNNIYKNQQTLIDATSFHYKSFTTPSMGNQFIEQQMSHINDNSSMIHSARRAKKPFQYISSLYAVSNNEPNDICSIPITQDASSSAYQIMSFFLLDEQIARSTNLFPSLDGEIQDIYSDFLNDLLQFINQEMEDKNLALIVITHFNRKIVKSIFMPIIYGKTLISTAEDVKKELSKFITKKESIIIAKVIYEYWTRKCPKINCLMRLIKNIGWFASKLDRPILYDMQYLLTVQDYHKIKTEYIWVYDSVLRKKRKISLRLPTEDRNSRKTETSTFVNFIHQKDAYIAMNVVEKMNKLGAPVYTVHDNFITTVKYSNYLPKIYGNIINEMGPPLPIILQFMAMNLRSKGEDWRDAVRIDNMDNIINDDYLKSKLMEEIPAHISKNKKKVWENRITEIIKSYSEYKHMVCDDLPKNASHSQCMLSHMKKWKEFQSNWIDSSNGRPWYCVHY